MRDYVLGLDIGGTKIAVGILDGNDKLIGRTQFSAKAGESPEMVFTLLTSSIDELLKRYDLAKDDISSIGVGVPGIISSDARSVLFAPNISILNSFDIYGSLKAEFPDAFIVIENDANCAGYAEYKAGSGLGRKNMIYCTISTGVGGAIIINGDLFRGSNMVAGEIGHMIIHPGGRLCGCGNKGCAEAYAGGANYPRYIKECLDNGRKSIISELAMEHGKIDGEVLSKAIDMADPFALEVFNEITETIGLLFFNIYKLLNIDCYVLGGGFTNVGEKLFNGIREHFEKYRVGTDTHDRVDFIPAHFPSSEIGIYGAALVAKYYKP